MPGDEKNPKKRSDAPEVDEPKAMLSLRLPESLAARVRNAVLHLSGPKEFETLAKLAERAFRAEVEKLERRHNDGDPFPDYGNRLKPGRRTGG